MTVKELIDELQKYDENLEVLTKKTEIFGNCAYVFSVRLDNYSYFGGELPCVLLTDECDSEEEDK